MIEYLTISLKYIVTNIALGTFFIALLTFGITLANFYRNRASISITQLPGAVSVLIKPDFTDLKIPDRYWHNEYRLITDIIITNRSAKPISIIEFTLNKEMTFNSYHVPAKSYDITVKPRETYNTAGTIRALGSSEVISYPIGEEWLKPLIDLPPYASVRGHLFFHFSNTDMISTHSPNELIITTSRKTFTTDLNVTGTHVSRISPPESIQKARNEKWT
ncbi:hypothetical protein Q0N12_04355 [Rossellomorea marisflavi]|uniref:hypothetical protein n=1 Tax=Rossellomorea marisflavi TaxID=189381 RepID=UPI0034595D03